MVVAVPNKHIPSFCHHHAHLPTNHINQYLFTRDILHALLVPVVELFDKAVGTAEVATRAQTPEELEYAYSGEARGAFTWLQCFLLNEREWTYSRGCPACIVSHSLDSEFTIRLLYAACLLSDVHYPFTLEGPTLPSFIFFLDSLQAALDADPLWGPDFFDLTTPKAIATRNGIEDLIHQCLELDAFITSAPSTPSDPSTPAASVEVSPVLAPMGGKPGMRVKRSKMAKRLARLEVEQEEWVGEMLQKCSLQLQLDGVSHGLAPMRMGELDAVVKEGGRVEVREVGTEERVREK